MGVSVTVADARFAKPIDADLLRRLALEHELLVTVEEGAVGGFATLAMESLQIQGLHEALARVCPLYLPDVFIDHDKPVNQVAQAGLDASAIVAAVLARLEAPKSATAAQRLAAAGR